MLNTEQIFTKETILTETAPHIARSTANFGTKQEIDIIFEDVD